MNSYDKAEALRTLFHGLCLYWEIPVEESEDPAAMSDFSFPQWRHVYAVILAEPEDRQAEIRQILFYGNRVLILDETDLEAFRQCPGPASAQQVLGGWLIDGTHASHQRQRMGISA